MANVRRRGGSPNEDCLEFDGSFTCEMPSEIPCQDITSLKEKLSNLKLAFHQEQDKMRKRFLEHQQQLKKCSQSLKNMNANKAEREELDKNMASQSRTHTRPSVWTRLAYANRKPNEKYKGGCGERFCACAPKKSTTPTKVVTKSPDYLQQNSRRDARLNNEGFNRPTAEIVSVDSKTIQKLASLAVTSSEIINLRQSLTNSEDNTKELGKKVNLLEQQQADFSEWRKEMILNIESRERLNSEIRNKIEQLEVDGRKLYENHQCVSKSLKTLVEIIQPEISAAQQEVSAPEVKSIEKLTTGPSPSGISDNEDSTLSIPETALGKYSLAKDDHPQQEVESSSSTGLSLPPQSLLFSRDFNAVKKAYLQSQGISVR